MRTETTFVITALVLAMVAGTAMGKLVAYYPLDEGTGTTIIDASGNGHNGTVESGPATWIDAQLGYGKALFFDSSNPAKGYVNCGTWNPSSATGRLSVALWVRYEGTNANYQGVVAKRDNWDPAASPPMMWYIECSQGTGAMSLATRDTYPAGAGTPPTGQWAHVAFTFDGTTVRSYMNGTEVGSGAFAFGPKTDAAIFIGCDNGGGYNGFNGAIDDVRIYDNALTPDEVRASMVAGSGPKSASSARPEDGATDVPRDTILAWKPGKYAATHDVYFGSVRADVASADQTSSLLVSPSQDANTFDPAVVLGYGETYFWRIDEVNAAPDSSVFKGDVWSFTTEPYAYTITGVTATASTAATNMPASKTVDGSGLNADGEHSVTDVDGWLTAAQAKLPAWIQFDFGRPYTLQTMHVWNSNQRMESIVGFGARDVVIEYSLDGTTWTPLSTMEFPKADGTATYAGFAVDMGYVVASSVRLTIQKNWSPYPTLQQTG
ncbi:MAG: discoidin domain-containing protein, partial [Sedimentisphaerales bacterium]|nr:discoidin domain-containing protein [Sedimentisphaerales bacterium]